MSIIQLIESKILDSSFDKTPIIIISGPTGVGKSNLALSLAKKINVRILSYALQSMAPRAEPGPALHRRKDQAQRGGRTESLCVVDSLQTSFPRRCGPEDSTDLNNFSKAIHPHCQNMTLKDLE